MTEDSGTISEATASEQLPAYLLTWDGRSWRDVVRLKPGHVTTIGRSSTNRIVLHDQSASRNHCELFCSDNMWTLRDHGSRNGTRLNGTPVSGDAGLSSGDEIEIGSCRLVFTHSLDRPTGFDDGREADASAAEGSPSEDVGILHATATAEFLQGGSATRESSAVLARLYQLGLQMGAAESVPQLTELVVEALARETVAGISAVLLAGPDAGPRIAPVDLQLAGWCSQQDLPYRRVSDNLSRVVLGRREAILAKDVADDQQLSMFDSLGEMRALSVICAPISTEERTLGVIHLYATNPENALNRDDLDFTIAVASQLAVALNRLRERDQLATGLQRVRLANDQLQQELRGEHKLLGDSAAMVTLREQVQLFAATDATVLIRGESGCGKELIARSLHHQSQRAESPFICVNCAALNENLLESELFGHEKGAFTGALERRAGRFEQADGGTLFLDEVGEMSAAVQAKFLRILEGHPFERIGGHTPIHADVRIVAATNRDLEAAVEDGSFRRDLYFRLQVAELNALPLRDRPDDVALLATVFLNRFVRRIGRAVTGFTDEALRRLQDYSWPGNVRELQNTIERTVILCRSEVVREEDLLLSDLGTRHMPAEAISTGCTTEFTERSLADIEREQILATLEHTDWNKSRAAQILGIERSTLDRKLKRYHVQRPPS